ncbi:MAG: phosphoribosylanthranilate isomerase [Deltaproteobacteria bacterium]
MRAKVKICGITNLDDALFAAESGADALGFVFWKKSPRFVEPSVVKAIVKALPPFVSCVGVFVDEEASRVNGIARQAGLSCVQLHGSETPEFCRGMELRVIKAFRIKVTPFYKGGLGGIKQGNDIASLSGYDVSAFLLDSYSEGAPGGTGKVFDWDCAIEAKKYGKVILAGGLTPGNIEEALRKVGPYGVDVSSGVESSPGKKDKVKVKEFIRLVRGFCDGEKAGKKSANKTA